MHGIEPVVDKIGRGTIDRFTSSSAEAIVRECRCETGLGNARQLIPHIPGVGCSHPSIGAGGEIAVEVIGLGGGAECELLIIGVIGRRGENRRDVGAGKGGARLDAIVG